MLPAWHKTGSLIRMSLVLVPYASTASLCSPLEEEIPTTEYKVHYGTCVVYQPRYIIEECDWYKGEELTA